uniref:RING-type domain-containing protein n=1 Tax=Globodera pallida TaxID=36090 RepID=A0A183C362_GLOPA
MLEFFEFFYVVGFFDARTTFLGRAENWKRVKAAGGLGIRFRHSDLQPAIVRNTQSAPHPCDRHAEGERVGANQFPCDWESEDSEEGKESEEADREGKEERGGTPTGTGDNGEMEIEVKGRGKMVGKMSLLGLCLIVFASQLAAQSNPEKQGEDGSDGNFDFELKEWEEERMGSSQRQGAARQITAPEEMRREDPGASEAGTSSSSSTTTLPLLNGENDVKLERYTCRSELHFTHFSYFDAFGSGGEPRGGTTGSGSTLWYKMDNDYSEFLNQNDFEIVPDRPRFGLRPHVSHLHFAHQVIKLHAEGERVGANQFPCDWESEDSEEGKESEEADRERKEERGGTPTGTGDNGEMEIEVKGRGKMVGKMILLGLCLIVFASQLAAQPNPEKQGEDGSDGNFDFELKEWEEEMMGSSQRQGAARQITAPEEIRREDSGASEAGTSSSSSTTVCISTELAIRGQGRVGGTRTTRVESVPNGHQSLAGMVIGQFGGQLNGQRSIAAAEFNIVTISSACPS